MALKKLKEREGQQLVGKTIEHGHLLREIIEGLDYYRRFVASGRTAVSEFSFIGLNIQ